ncbi:MAG: flagellar hook-basal body complex protein FliE [candidate division Zixibacteria bacterium]|jgi:flagellar hook-basal body complex protein FliE|nr:flagellar hook-basal body complex protein FliE [candidate division Zixibacteria bacterium]
MNPIQVNIPSQIVDLPSLGKTNKIQEEGGESFGQMLKSFVQDVNALQHNSGDIENKFLTGEVTDVHQVMLAAEEASVAFELLMEIRNKLLESYKEIIRTPA